MLYFATFEGMGMARGKSAKYKTNIILDETSERVTGKVGTETPLEGLG